MYNQIAFYCKERKFGCIHLSFENFYAVYVAGVLDMGNLPMGYTEFVDSLNTKVWDTFNAFGFTWERIPVFQPQSAQQVIDSLIAIESCELTGMELVREGSPLIQENE